MDDELCYSISACWRPRDNTARIPYAKFITQIELRHDETGERRALQSMSHERIRIILNTDSKALTERDMLTAQRYAMGSQRAHVLLVHQMWVTGFAQSTWTTMKIALAQCTCSNFTNSSSFCAGHLHRYY